MPADPLRLSPGDDLRAALEDVLRQLGVQDFSRAVVGIGTNLEASVLTVLALGFGARGLALAALFMAALIFLRHRANIARLAAGTEPRIGRKT